MLTHIAGQALTLCACWRFLRADAVVRAFTDHDTPLVYGAYTYQPIAAGNLSNISQSNKLSVDNQDIEQPFETGFFTEAELRAGIWDGAEYWVFLVNWEDLGMGDIKLSHGWLGQSEIGDYSAKIEMRSLTQRLAIPVGRVMTPECSANLGDARCKVSLAGYTHAGTVSSVVTARRVVAITGAAAGKTAGYYDYGKITWTSGANAGLSMAVKSYDYSTNYVTLLESMPYDITAGDAFSLQAGCDRRLATCRDRFNNVLNFRGWPHIPGTDKPLNIPGNRTWTTNS
jgi:uncharacterized phage protein (TIGR02218 family)